MSCSDFSDVVEDNYTHRRLDNASLPYKSASFPSWSRTEFQRQMREQSTDISKFRDSLAPQSIRRAPTFKNTHETKNIHNNSFEFDSSDDDDDASSLASILDAFNDLLATPPSTCWEGENENPVSYDEGFFKTWNSRAVVHNSKYRNEQLPPNNPNFISQPTYTMSPIVETIGKNIGVKKCSSASQLLSTTPYNSIDLTSSFGYLKNSPSFQLHRASKSWPVRTSSTASLPSLPSLALQSTEKKLFSAQINPVVPKSRTSDLSTCATLVPTSPVRSIYEQPASSCNQEEKALKIMETYVDQRKTCEIRLPASCNTQYHPECEKSSWDSDDDDDSETVHNESSYFYFGSAWPRFGRPQMHVIKKKLGIGKQNVSGSENLNKSGKWQEAVRKSSEGKKKMAHILRGVLRLKNPSIS